MDVSVRWGVVFVESAVLNCLKMKEAFMNSFTSMVLSGVALLPVSGDYPPPTRRHGVASATGLPRSRARGSIPLTGYIDYP